MFGIKKKINIHNKNLDEFNKFKTDPAYFFRTCMPEFKSEKFNNNALSLTVDNDIHIIGDRQTGTTTTIALTILYKALFNKDKTYIYVRGLNYHCTQIIFDILSDAIETIYDNSNVFSKNEIVRNRTRRSIEFKNENKIMAIKEGDFINQIRGIGANVIIALDEFDDIDPRIRNNINECIKYLRIQSRLATLYGN